MASTDPAPGTHPATLHASLHFYEEAILLTRYDGPGSTTFPVAASEVVTILGQLPVSTGLLPEGCLFWQQQAGQTCLAIQVPARRWQLREGRTTLAVPLPPLVLVGHATRYWLYAVKALPVTARTVLFHAPLPNVAGTGAVCAGNTPMPTCSATTIHDALHLILEGSAFNGHLAAHKCRRHPTDVRLLWRDLVGKRRFPLRELLPSTVILGNWLEGRPPP